MATAISFSVARANADSISDNSIVFVTMVPNPTDFGTLAATFANQVADPDTAFRGGDLWIRYSDGSVKNLTQTAGFGNDGFQGANSIAVRDPAVSYDGTKVLFSMVVGAPTQQYQAGTFRWQLYEASSLGKNESPIITKVSGQPSNYNNISPAYANDDTIIFVSDRPRDDSILQTYPQRDEYESTAVNSGLWKLNPQSGFMQILDHAPSGNFNPIVDSFGRVVFTRWDHMQRDQQNAGASFGAFNYQSETSNAKTSSNAEVFPEPRTDADPDKQANTNVHSMNQFFPWMMNQDGTAMETLNHFGRHEVGVYIERSFNDDPNVQEYYGQYQTGQNRNPFEIFLHIKEDPTHPGTYLGTSCQEFGTHASGQIISIDGAPSVNADDMLVNYLTHPDTRSATDSPSQNDTGMYRDPLPLSNGQLIASHSVQTRVDANTGSSTSPLSRYAYKLKLLTKTGQYYAAATNLVSDISKSINFWSPDAKISYSGPLWEMMAVELKNRDRPGAPTTALPDIEAGVIASMGVQLDDLKNYLHSQDLALVVSRNLTSRDKNDRQQPTNLRVTGTSTQNIPKSGKIYDISLMQFFQGDLLRSYNDLDTRGRRVLAQRMHSVGAGVNPTVQDAAIGSTQIASDGSMAAFVPARRALTWQMTDGSGHPVVRERYWVTFQAGEIRVCTSCHGVNTVDQSGHAAPNNPPLALAQLIAHWKNLPPPNATPSPIKAPAPTPRTLKYSLKVSGVPSLQMGGKFLVTGTGGSRDTMKVKVTFNKYVCSGTHTMTGSSTTRTLSGKFPKVSGATVAFGLTINGSSATKAAKSVRIPSTRKKLARISKSSACRSIMNSLRKS